MHEEFMLKCNELLNIMSYLKTKEWNADFTD